MLKSIQWKLVIIYVLLVWLAMSIIGLYIVQTIEKDQVKKKEKRDINIFIS